MSDRKAVIVIDLQKDYLWNKRKTKFTYDTENLIRNVNSAITAYKVKGYDIIYIKHILPKLLWGVGFSIRGTEGADHFHHCLDLPLWMEESGRRGKHLIKEIKKLNKLLKRRRLKK